MENEVGRRASQALSANGGHYPVWNSSLAKLTFKWDAPIEDDSCTLQTVSVISNYIAVEYFAVPTSSVTRGGTRPSVATYVDVK